MRLSIVINADTRDGFQNESSQAEGLFNGTKSQDFLIDGVLNKIAFFEGYEKEIILHIDKHQNIPIEILSKLQEICDTVLIRKHTNEEKFNDWSYLRALQLSTGDIICHFDQDTAAFTQSEQSIEEYISLLDKYDYVSYPSYWSPNPVVDDNYDYFWCSTRFFMCKRGAFDFVEIKKCLQDSDYLYGKYPASVRNPWTEHIIALISKYTGKGVYYPTIELDKLAIFSWGSYKQGTLKMLNNLPYEQVKKWIYEHPIHYPNDIDA